MENIKSRSRARIVAGWDFITTLLNLVYFAYDVFNFGVQTERHNGLKEIIPDYEETALGLYNSQLLAVLGIRLSIGGLFLCIGVWTAYEMFQNTTPKSDPVVALEKTVIWRNVGIIFMSMQLGFTVYTFTFATFDPYCATMVTLDFVYNVLLISCVSGFINDLQKTCDANIGLHGKGAGKGIKV